MSGLSRSNATLVRTKKKLVRPNLQGLQITPAFKKDDSNGSDIALEQGPESSTTPNEIPTISQLVGHNPVDYTPLIKEVTQTDIELNPNTVQLVKRLGEGAGGTVSKVIHTPTNLVMAKKSVPADPDPNTYRQIMRELQFLKQCQSPHIVSFYGAYLDIDQTTISMCMEYCQGGSLDDIYKRVQKLNQGIGEGILGKIAEAVCGGLVYLHDNKIIHRDVKPSNILVTAEGNIKLCDFGVSGVLVHSIAQTFVGTSYYMAPERIQGYGYAVQSDIWSLGLTLLEIANGRFPFPPPGHPPLAIFELLDFIVKMPVPELSKPTLYSDEYKSFISDCLIKDPNHRPTPKRLLNDHPFLIRSLSTSLNLSQWINQVWA